MRFFAVLLLVGAAQGFLAPTGWADPPSPLRAGAATCNITPSLGCEIIGGFAPIPATQIHDELHARCLVLDDGQTRLAIVVCDLLGLDRAVSDEARRMIQQDSAIPPAHVMISATHTHSACSALGGEPLNEYQQFLARQIAEGVAEAQNQLRQAEIGFGTVEIPEHVFNRRWHMRPGTMPTNPFGRGDDQVKMNPPAGSVNLVEPAGPVDPTVSFLSIRATDGTPISLFATYSLHYVGGVGPGHVSADYFAMFCEEIVRLHAAEHQIPPMVPMLANGTSGDINNINFREPRAAQPPYAQMRHVAVDVARRVHAALDQISYRSDLTLEARYREPQIAYRHPDEELLKWAKTTLESTPESGGTNLSRIYAERTLNMAALPETTTIPLQVLRIGGVVIATMPCEVFCEIGLEFRERSAIKPSFMVSLAHGYFGYLPTPRQHRLGGYETWLGTNQLEPSASNTMLDQLVEMTEELAQ